MRVRTSWVLALVFSAAAGSAQPVQPPWIFGMHDPGVEGEIETRGKRGWIVFTEAIGHDPNDGSGKDYRPWSSRGHGVIVRLNNGYGSEGTLPHENEYGGFAERVANFIQSSPGADIWIIGNETNLPREWPGNVNGDPATGEAITPERYVSCFGRVGAELERRGITGEILVPAPSGTWAPPYDGTLSSFPNRGVPGFLDYWVQVLNALGPSRVEGLAIHAYTHGGTSASPIDPNLVFSEQKMGWPYQNIYYHFRVYQNFMAAIPESMRSLPVWITEANELRELAGYNWDPHGNTSQWVENAYAEIHEWNSNRSNQAIRALALFRWPDVWEGDRNYCVSCVGSAVEGVRQALHHDYRWTDDFPPAPAGNNASVGRTESLIPASIRAGEAEEVEIRVQNTGGTTWTAGELYRLGATSSNQFFFEALPCGGYSLAPDNSRAFLCSGDAIAPGEWYVFRFRFRASTTSGTLVLSLRMVRDGVEWFGDPESWNIVIDESRPPPEELIQNGDFSNGLTGWSSWNERGRANPTVVDGQVRLESDNHNGGVYQQFSTGGAGRRFSVSGFWAASPSLPAFQWAEVLILNSDRIPLDGEDVREGESDVVLVYKNDTWASPRGWSGPMARTAPVTNAGEFVAAGSVATLVLKGGNLGGAVTGTRFDDIGLAPHGDFLNRPPTAVITAEPTSGPAPLLVSFSGSGSSDPDGDTLRFLWSFGDGTEGSGSVLSHTYTREGTYVATLTADDSRGGAASASIVISVGVSPSKLGVHVVIGPRNGYGDFLRKIRDAGRFLAAVHCVDDFGACAEAKEYDARTITVGRLHSHEYLIDLGKNPEANAEEFYQAVRSRWLALSSIDYWEAQNEINSGYGWQKRFYLRLMELAEADGLKLALFAASTGTPPRPEDDGGVAYENIKDTCLRARPGGHILSLHEYGGVPTGSTLRGTEPYHALRYRTLYDYLRQFDAVVPLVISECAQNAGYQYPGVETFMDDFRWYDGELTRDDYLLGATIFTLGNWANANFQEALDALGDHIARTGR